MHTSLFTALLGIVAGGDAYAAVRIGNATRNNYYAAQMAEQRAAQQFASVNQVSNSTADTPIATTERDIESLQDAKLSACSSIYPNGEFAIARPTAGLGIGAGNMCVAVVELRMIGSNNASVSDPNKGYTVLARANVASGSSVKCNISEFPESSYTADAQNVLFPADAEPTVQDVIKVMNQEQKQNAGLKIAAGALIGAVGGNLSGKNDIGKDGLFGTSKSQVTNTVIGAVGGAAIGAGGAYAGKVGGDMIMSTGINAAAGGVVGNIMAAGDSVLRIEKCNVNGAETSCLWGYLVTGPDLKSNISEKPDLLCKGDSTTDCYKYFIDLDDGQSVFRCDVNGAKCVLMNNLVSIRVNDGTTTGGKPLEGMERKDLDALKNGDAFYMAEDKTMVPGLSTATSHAYRLIESAKIDDGKKVPALIADFTDSTFGKKAADWRTWKSANSNAPIYYRNGDGSAGENQRTDTLITLDNFYPMYIDADDGGIIDLGNKARLKSTLIGAGAGGALGAFTAYQGAQDDIDARWVSAVREYKDSLQKFYCITGSRFLSYYNDTLIIPNINE